jgi:hypothetical protein
VCKSLVFLPARQDMCDAIEPMAITRSFTSLHELARS